MFVLNGLTSASNGLVLMLITSGIIVFLLLGFSNKSNGIEIDDDKEEFDIKDSQDEINKSLQAIVESRMNPSYNSLYFFQFIFLPNLFYINSVAFDMFIINEGIQKLLEIFKFNTNETYRFECYLTEDMMELREFNFTDNKKLILLSIPDLNKVVSSKYKMSLCNHVYFYINLDNPRESQYFTFENHDLLEDNIVFLCSVHNNQHLNLGVFQGNTIDDEVNILKQICRIK